MAYQQGQPVTRELDGVKAEVIVVSDHGNQVRVENPTTGTTHVIHKTDIVR